MVVVKTVFLSIVCTALLVSAAQAQHDPYDDDTVLEFYWDAASGNVDHYNVYLSINGAAYIPVDPIDRTPTSIEPYIVNVEGEGEYLLQVQAVAEDGSTGPMSEPSELVTVRLPRINVEPESLVFNAVTDRANPDDQTLEITNTGYGTLNWTISDDAGWLSCTPPSGECTDEIDETTVSVDSSGLPEGTYYAEITISATYASNTPQTVSVTLNILFPEWDMNLGWNFISTPIRLPSNALESVLQSIDGSYDSVLTYDAMNDKWERHIVDGPAFLKDLTTIESGRGYLIRVTTVPAVLTLDGYEVADDSITLKRGWNLIGYNGSAPRLIVDVLLSIAGNYNSVWTYDAENGKWKRYVVDGPELLNDLETMEPGKAYWIDAIDGCEIFP